MSFWTATGLPDPITEFKFHPVRKWRFDYAWPDRKVALEIEGGIWNRGAHVRALHYMSDMEKYNEAQKLGWRVFRFTPQQFKKGDVQSFLLDVFKTGAHP
jgi:very-short-patch-repair endonuclease